MLLKRLPQITQGVFSKFGIVHSVGNEGYDEMRYINFLITDDVFEISEGGSVYSKDVGGDTYSVGSWKVEIGGFRDIEYELFGLEDRLEEYINFGAAICVNDESNMDYDT